MRVFPSPTEDIPYITTEQMIEVDRLMIEQYHIELIQMMENAGRSLAHLARRRFLDDRPNGKRVAVLAGTGGNGGGALVCARRLHNYGTEVEVFTSRSSEAFRPVSAHQLDILARMGLPISEAGSVGGAHPPDLIIDGVIGYSLNGAPRGGSADLIRWANDSQAPVLALDVPSGLDASSGTIYDPVVEASATLTLALPKKGLRAPGIEPLLGELYLADISVPPGLYGEPSLGLAVGPIFAHSDILYLDGDSKFR
jgi:NAD(P)H-hydrate epimerase